MNTNTTLALSDGWTIAMAAINLIMSLIMGLGLFWLKAKFQEIWSLKNDIKTSAEQLINQRFNTLRESIELIDKRLEKGDNDFRANVERDHQLEIKTLQTVESIRREMASRAEIAKLSSELSQLDRRVTQVEGRGAA